MSAQPTPEVERVSARLFDLACDLRQSVAVSPAELERLSFDVQRLTAHQPTPEVERRAAHVADYAEQDQRIGELQAEVTRLRELVTDTAGSVVHPEVQYPAVCPVCEVERRLLAALAAQPTKGDGDE
jgi:hypothetical protein